MKKGSNYTLEETDGLAEKPKSDFDKGSSLPKASVPNPGYAWNPLSKYPRNKRCFCGSPKKFKRCCIRTIPEVVTVSEAEKLSEFMAQLK